VANKVVDCLPPPTLILSLLDACTARGGSDAVHCYRRRTMRGRLVDEPGQETNGGSCLLCRARRADAHLVFPLYKLLLLLLARSDVPTCLSVTTIIYIFIRINCSFKNKKLKKINIACQRAQRVKCILTVHNGSAK